MVSGRLNSRSSRKLVLWEDHPSCCVGGSWVPRICVVSQFHYSLHPQPAVGLVTHVQEAGGTVGAVLLEGLPHWLSGQCRHGLDHLLLTRRSQLWEAKGRAGMGHTHLTLKTKRNMRRDSRGPVGQGGLYGELGPTLRIQGKSQIWSGSYMQVIR